MGSPGEDTYTGVGVSAKKMPNQKRNLSSKSERMHKQLPPLSERRNLVKPSQPFVHPLTKITKVKILTQHHRRTSSVKKGYETSSSMSSLSNKSSSDGGSSANHRTYNENYSIKDSDLTTLQRERSLEKIYTFSLRPNSKNMVSPTNSILSMR